jgi:OFA family oxalate/formate antiporter-like MFS transporter
MGQLDRYVLRQGHRHDKRHGVIFRGWLVVAGAFALTLLGFGSAYTFSAFIEPLEHAFHASRGSASLVFSLAGFLYFALGIVSGPLADRWGSRRIAALGMLVAGIGMVLAGFASSLTGVYLAYGLGIGLGVGLSYVPAIGAVQRWFVRRRGLASGLAVSGIGVGTLVMPPLASSLIAALGWRHAYMVLGLLVAIPGCALALLITNDPHAHGLAPDGDPVDMEAHHAQKHGVSIATAVTSWRFVGLYLACLIGSFGLFVPFVHLVPYAQDHGIAPSSAVLLLGMIGIGSTLGRFAPGRLADQMGRLLGVLAMFIGIGLSMVMWVFYPVMVSRRVRLRLRRLLWRVRGIAAGRCDGRFRRQERQRPDRHPLHQRRVRNADRPKPCRLRVRRQPQLQPADLR